jgi:hypothetical protein
MVFRVENIIGDSCATYCSSVGKSPKNYQLRGVDCYVRMAELSDLVQGSNGSTPKDFLAKKVPKGAEKVVEYQVDFVGMFFYCRGTALIPKEE